jgi:GNAT superfamily N-acetyltransferase
VNDPTIRRATRSDIAAMHVVRLAVRENQLVSAVITTADYEREIEATGRGWVAELGGELAGFAIGNAESGNIWALFVDPKFERRGVGRALHDTLVGWLFGRGLERLWLTTAPQTRAFDFYLAAGWRAVGDVMRGEQRFELAKDDWRVE